MKSIMEQASSIIKAIEKAWISADRPKEFSVKIFEKEEKNFFGITTKPAKIGIFFSDKTSFSQEKTGQKPRSEIKDQRVEIAKKHQAASTVKPTITKHIVAEKSKTTDLLQKTQSQRIPTTWNNSMIDSASTWINKILNLMNMNSVSFNSEVSGKILKLTFSEPLLENPLIEKNLFRSIAHLIMASLRNQYKQEIKDLKIVLIRPQ